MTIQRYFGFGEETARGTEQATTAYDLTDGVSNVGLDTPKDPNIEVPTLQRFQQRSIPGFYSPDGDVEVNMDINTIGWFLKWALGGYTFTEGATSEDPNTHEFYVTQDRSLPSFTSRIGKDTFEHTFLGCVINKLSMTVEKDLVSLKNSIIAVKDKKDTLRESSALNLINSDLFPLAFYNVNTTVDAVDVSADVTKWGLDFENGLKAEDGQGQGSRFAQALQVNDGKISLSITMKTSDASTLLAELWGSATGPVSDQCDPITSFEVESVFDSGDFGSCTVNLPSCLYTEIPTDYKGGETIEPDIAVKPFSTDVLLADAATTVQTPILITLSNFEDEYVLSTPP